MLLKAPWDQNYGVLFNGSIMFLFVKKSRIKLKVVLNKLAFLLVVFFGGVYYQVIIQYQNFLVDLLTVTESLMVLLYEILKKRKINFFTWALLFYLILNLLNPILILFNKEYGTHYFYLTVIVMMFFALFFSMFTDTSKMLIINLKSGRNSYGN